MIAVIIAFMGKFDFFEGFTPCWYYSQKALRIAGLRHNAQTSRRPLALWTWYFGKIWDKLWKETNQ